MGVLSDSLNNRAATIQATPKPVTSSAPRSNSVFVTSTPPPSQAPSNNGSFFSGGLFSKAMDILSLPTYAFASFNQGINKRAKELQAEARPSGQTAFQQKGIGGIFDALGAGFNNVLPGISKRTSFGKGPDNYDVASEIGVKDGFANDAVNFASNIVAPSIPAGKIASVTGKVASKIPGAAKIIPNLATKIGFGQKAATTTDLVPTAGKLVENTGEVLNRQIPGWKQFFNRASNNIASQGQWGQSLAQDLKTWRDVAERSAGMWVDRLRPVAELSKKEFDTFIDYAEGKVPPNTLPPTAKLQNALAAWDSVRKEVVDIADNIGLQIGARENYFPHVFDSDFFKNRSNFQSAVEHLVKTGQAATNEDAAKLLRDMSRRIKASKYGNLEAERIANIPGWKRDKDALFNYVERAASRLSEVATFGKDYEKALGKIAKLSDEGFDGDTTQKLFRQAVGDIDYGSMQSKASRIIRTGQAITKLGLGAFTNVGQNVNTATTVGILRTLKNIPGAMSSEKRQFALRAGVTLDGVLKDLAEGGGFTGSVLGKAMTMPGFNQVEKFNRTLAAWAGKEFADDLAKQAVKGDATAIRQLQKIGLNPQSIIQNGGKLSMEEQITAARNIVERTQFKVDPQDLPGWASSPWGKVITQFKSFAYNQTAFMKREIYDEAAKGNFQPLIRFVVAAPIVGGGIRELRNVLTFRDSEEDPTKRAIGYYKQAGGLGLAGDIYEGFFPQNDKYLPPDRAALMAASSLFGPTASTVNDAAGAFSEARQGRYDAAGRFATKQIPIVGPAASNLLFPYKSQKKKSSGRSLPPLAPLK